MGKFKGIVNVVKHFGKEHSPEILTGVGVAGLLTSTVLAVRATPKAIDLIEDKKDELDCNKLSVKETVQATWKCYIPAAITSVTSVGCVVGGLTKNAKRNAALMTAYSISDTALKEYKNKVKEIVGEEKAHEIRESIDRDTIKKATPDNSVICEDNEVKCLDAVSGRYFKSDMETLRSIENDIDRRIRNEMYVSLNEWYFALGLNPISVGDKLGWHIDTGYMCCTYTSQLDEKGKPCLVVNTDVHVI